MPGYFVSCVVVLPERRLKPILRIPDGPWQQLVGQV
jgi:hypothetical protein